MCGSDTLVRRFVELGLKSSVLCLLGQSNQIKGGGRGRPPTHTTDISLQSLYFDQHSRICDPGLQLVLFPLPSDRFLERGLQVKFFAAPWPHLSLISVVDILLVAIIIYELLALIKGTRAAYMLVGVAALALAFYFSRVGELATLNWLLSTLLAVRGVRADRDFCG